MLNSIFDKIKIYSNVIKTKKEIKKSILPNQKISSFNNTNITNNINTEALLDNSRTISQNPENANNIDKTINTDLNERLLDQPNPEDVHETELFEEELESENSNKFFTRIKHFIISYIYSPYFIMHFTRLGIIVWVILFKSYISMFPLLWLFRSFTIISFKEIYYFSVVVFPFLLIQVFLYYLANIPGILLVENIHIANELGLQVFDSTIFPLYCFFMMIIIFIFVISIYIDNTYSGNIFDEIDSDSNKKDIEKKSKKTVNLSDIITYHILMNTDKLSIIFLFIVGISAINIIHLSKIIIKTYIIHIIYINL